MRECRLCWFDELANPLSVSHISFIGGAICTFGGVNGSSVTLAYQLVREADVSPPQAQVFGTCQNWWWFFKNTHPTKGLVLEVVMDAWVVKTSMAKDRRGYRSWLLCILCSFFANVAKTKKRWAWAGRTPFSGHIYKDPILYATYKTSFFFFGAHKRRIFFLPFLAGSLWPAHATLQVLVKV